jgi:hypothetical protein
VTDRRSALLQVLAFVVAVAAPSAAHAQGTTSTWPVRFLSNLPTVYVLDDTGTETAGKLLHLNPDSLVLLVGDTERRFEEGRIRRIQGRGDSVRNGLIIGAVIGAATGLIGAGVADCPGEDPGGHCPGSRIALGLFSTGVYAAIGTGIDALISGRTTLYEAPIPPSSRMRGQGPARVAALNVRVRW